MRCCRMMRFLPFIELRYSCGEVRGFSAVEIMAAIIGRIRHLPWLGAESTAVRGFDGSVGPDFDGEDEISGGAGVAEVAFAGEELAELLQ